ncbi:transcription factor TFIIIB complex subunit bdp1 [Schizosaccharomyces cryophilus OY26]|uniref:Transcription factor TFIIIB complex subunit bdp1 n=1 Tax=Schizosaccharomyces cryophilus (strain OY26 / ATCC MYA-4695 / CBS 11777 / NBRC 106824 / NRRL Y48691) TaxID=653667 RepID=S9VTF3_SCHCR|nr:transcription factor TFIIIB complex subunit bdp1 [Schizosaccharomyces cryophilus OY26]EPY51158.1 transcription factor TFIIIB complex subunit bdp1 [Schizosaccharomyces cryophilus OY26]
MSAKLISSPLKNPYSKFAPKFTARKERSVEKTSENGSLEVPQEEILTDLNGVNEEPVVNSQEGRDSFNILVEAAQEAQKLGNNNDEDLLLENNETSRVFKPTVEPASALSNNDESDLTPFEVYQLSGQVKRETPVDENIPLSQISSVAANFEDVSGSQSKRMTNASIRRRKRKLIVDNVGTEQESININETKMSALCDDPGIGRKSQRFVEIEKLLLEEKMAKRKKRTGSVTPGKEESPQRDLKTANNTASQTSIQEPEEEEEEVVGTLETEPEEKDSETQEESNIASKSILDQLADKMDSEGQLNSSGASAPRTRVVDGQIVLDEASLEIDRHQRDYVPEEDREFVEENALSRRVTSATWGNRQKSEKWKADETEKFYKALSQWGTDFALISNMFPIRNRRQIKLKFKQEEKRNPARINEALRTKKPVDMEEYSKESGKVFRPVEEVEKELAHIRSAFEEERKRAVETAEQRQIIANYEAEQERNAPPPKQERDVVFEDGIEVVGQLV